MLVNLVDSQLFFGSEPLVAKLTKYGGTVFLKFDIFTDKKF